MSHLQLFVAERGGVASRADLLSAGFSRDHVQRALAKGTITVAVPGVYVSPGRSPDSWDTRCRVALAHAGSGAATSHWTSAAWWDLRRVRHLEPIHICIPHGRQCRAPSGVVIHHSRQLEVVEHAGVPVTPVLRTLVDITAASSLADSRMIVFDAVGRGLAHSVQLRNVGHLPPRARRPWQLMVAEAEAGAISGGEAAYWRLIKDAGLPLPLLNQRMDTSLGHFFPDALWPDLAIFAEIDGRSVHAQRKAFDHDRIRRNAMHIHGLVALGFSVNDVLNQPALVVRQTRELIQLRWSQTSGGR